MGILDRIIARLRGRGSQAANVDSAALHRQLADAIRRGARAEALALCERILARAPDDQAALLAAGVNCLKTGAPAQAAAHFARLEALASGGANTARLVSESLIDPLRAGRGEPYVAALDEVLVDGEFWSVVDGERIYTQETQARSVSNSPRVRGRMTPDRNQCVITLPCAPQRIDAPCILLGSDANYAHWVLRNLLKLSLLETAGLPAGLPFLVGENLRGWQRAYLELLDIPAARLLPVPAGQIVACRRLYVPTQLRNHPRMAEGIAWLRGRLAPQLAAQPSDDAGALLYASRREQTNRRLLNEDAVEAMLAQMGFRIIVPGEMSVPAQIEAFSRARVVVAPHGAALANMVFAPPAATLVEICSSAILHMGEVRYLVGAAGQQVRTVVSEDLAAAPAGGGPEMHRDYRVSVEALRATVSEVLGARSAAASPSAGGHLG
jgi:capsular polysaccharide biosynthesis protein